MDDGEADDVSHAEERSRSPRLQTGRGALMGAAAIKMRGDGEGEEK